MSFIITRYIISIGIHIIGYISVTINISMCRVLDLFGLFEDTLQQHDITDKPTRIYNCDETGFSGKQYVRVKVVVRTRHPYQCTV